MNFFFFITEITKFLKVKLLIFFKHLNIQVQNRIQTCSKYLTMLYFSNFMNLLINKVFAINNYLILYIKLKVFMSKIYINNN